MNLIAQGTCELLAWALPRTKIKATTHHQEPAEGARQRSLPSALFMVLVE